MTKKDFLDICAQVDILPAVALECEGVRDLLKRDKGNPKIENQLLLHTLIHKHF